MTLWAPFKLEFADYMTDNSSAGRKSTWNSAAQPHPTNQPTQIFLSSNSINTHEMLVLLKTWQADKNLGKLKMGASSYWPKLRIVSLGTSLWLRVHQQMKGTQVWSLVQEDSTCCGATKLVSHNYWALASWRPWSAAVGAVSMRSPCTTAREQPLLTATRESPYSNEDPVQPQINF